LLRLADGAAEIAVLRKLGGEQAQKAVAFLDRQRPAGSHHQGKLIIRQADHANTPGFAWMGTVPSADVRW